MDKTLVSLAATITVIGAAFSIYRFLQSQGNEIRQTIRQGVAPGSVLYTPLATASGVLPSADATDPGFSNYARRSDLWAPPRLASGPLAYGEVLPQ